MVRVTDRYYGTYERNRDIANRWDTHEGTFKSLAEEYGISTGRATHIHMQVHRADGSTCPRGIISLPVHCIPVHWGIDSKGYCVGCGLFGLTNG